jgi:hypothetical protein
MGRITASTLLSSIPRGTQRKSSYGLPTPITPISWSSGPPPRPAIASLVRWVDGLSVDAGHRSSSWFRDVKGRHDERDIVRTGQRKRGMRIETKGGKMFDGNGFTLGLRRFRRSTVCIARNLDEAARLPELDGMLGELQLWAIGMPWVAQSPSGARERLKLFVLDWHRCRAMNHGSPSARSMTTRTMNLGLSWSFRTPSQRERHRSAAERESHRSGGSARSR